MPPGVVAGPGRPAPRLADGAAPPRASAVRRGHRRRRRRRHPLRDLDHAGHSRARGGLPAERRRTADHRAVPATTGGVPGADRDRAPGRFPRRLARRPADGGQQRVRGRHAGWRAGERHRRGGQVEFSGADAGPQRVVNLFYYCCLLHDLFYLLGFREADGNFQADTLSRGGVASDSVVATVFPGTVAATANMTTPKDGARPRLNVGIVEATGRHTALDATVVFHEYTHGVTSRLVGGPINTLSLTAAQSAGMSEGWSDFFACSITEEPVIGAWVVDNPDGIRRHRYDADYPGSFGDLGTPEFATKHQIGELWCATLMEFARGTGTPLALQVVVDSLKLAPANPSFLDARDAMLRALEGMRASGKLTAVAHAAARTALWTAFARFGMGPGASSDGARLDGLVEDFSTPGIPVVTPTRHSATARPRRAIPDKDPVGISSEVSFDVDGVVGTVEVAVDVAHEFRGDLEVTVTSPAGTNVVLRTADPDPGTDLVMVYDAASAPGLLGLTGQPIRGRWRLRVADRFRLSLGVFRSWTLTVTLR
ncbi:M36 family metallopeptidase [Pseudonocardia sp. T1-2H]|uniref:M36 family metallopeptidase n=1 Tax=Pseudonocardia sp. T1-2H TaxID=3128899 RepID=UPI003101AD0F